MAKEVYIQWEDTTKNPASLEMQRKLGTGTWVKVGNLTGQSGTYIDTIDSAFVGELRYRTRATKILFGTVEEMFSNEYSISVTAGE